MPRALIYLRRTSVVPFLGFDVTARLFDMVGQNYFLHEYLHVIKYRNALPILRGPSLDVSTLLGGSHVS